MKLLRSDIFVFANNLLVKGGGGGGLKLFSHYQTLQINKNRKQKNLVFVISDYVEVPLRENVASQLSNIKKIIETFSKNTNFKIN